MSNFVFNSAKGMVAYYATLPAASDALIAVAVASAGMQADSSMIAHTTLANVLAASTEQTTVGRQTLASVTVTPNNTTNVNVVDADDFTYVAATGAAIGAIIICYVPDTGTSTDATIIPLTKHDFSAIPSGVDIPVQIGTGGIFTAVTA